MAPEPRDEVATARNSLAREGRALVALPNGVGCGTRRELLAEFAWREFFPADEALHEALAFIRDRPVREE